MSQKSPKTAEAQTFSARIDELEADNTKLRARLTELEAELARARSHAEEGVARSGEERALRERQLLLSALVENSPSVIFVKDLEGRYVLANRGLEQVVGRPLGELLGARDNDIFPPETVRANQEKDREALEQGEPIQFEESVPATDGMHHYFTIKFPLFDLDGNAMGVCGIATDITEQKREQAIRMALQERIIAAKDEALRELSTPLLPIAEGILAMPLVGAIDSNRAAQIMDTLLDGIGRYRADTAILDITGVRTVDTHVANALVAAARSVRLLGASVVLTGIRPEVAQMLVTLGADLAGIVTRSTLQSGVAYALARRAQGGAGGREAGE